MGTINVVQIFWSMLEANERAPDRSTLAMHTRTRSATFIVVSHCCLHKAPNFMHNNVTRLLLGRAPGRTTFLSLPEVCVGALNGCISKEVAAPWRQPVRVEEGAVAVTHSDTAAARGTCSCCRPTGSVSPAAAGSTLLIRPLSSSACSSLHHATTALAPSAVGYHGFRLTHQSGTQRLGAVPAGSDCYRALSTSAAAPSSSSTSTSSSPSSTYLYSRPGPEPAAVLLEPLLQGRPFEVAQVKLGSGGDCFHQPQEGTGG